MKKDAYSRFKKYTLSEEEFRRYWGKRYEFMVEAMRSCNRLAEMSSKPSDKRKYKKQAQELYERAKQLGSVFMSLEDFRIGNPNKEEDFLP